MVAKDEALDEKTLLITSDSIATFDGCIREKPINAEQCRMWMKQYQQKPVHLCTGMVVTQVSTGKQVKI